MTKEDQGRGSRAARCCKVRRRSPGSPRPKPITGFPAVHAAEPVTLRYLGTAVNQSTDIAKKVKEDLGIIIEYVPVTTDVVTKRIITQPDSFDLVDVEYFSLPSLVPSGNLVGMDAKKIKLADDITTVLEQGHYRRQEDRQSGHCPLQGVLSRRQALEEVLQDADRVADAYSDHLQRGLARHPAGPHRPVRSSTGRNCSNPQFKGKAALINVPSIGIMDAAMAIELSRRNQIRRQGQPDQGRDRQNHRNPHQSQKRRPVPRLLDRLQRVGKPHGIG